MAEENQVEPLQITKEPQGKATQVPRVMKEPQQVTTKKPKESRSW